MSQSAGRQVVCCVSGGRENSEEMLTGLQRAPEQKGSQRLSSATVSFHGGGN